jgi:hypothetical protein
VSRQWLQTSTSPRCINSLNAAALLFREALAATSNSGSSERVRHLCAAIIQENQWRRSLPSATWIFFVQSTPAHSAMLLLSRGSTWELHGALDGPTQGLMRISEPNAISWAEVKSRETTKFRRLQPAGQGLREMDREACGSVRRSRSSRPTTCMQQTTLQSHHGTIGPLAGIT